MSNAKGQGESCDPTSLSSSEIIKSERHLVWTYPERTINRVSPIACPWIDYRPNQKKQWSLGLEQEVENVSPKHGILSHGDSHLPIIFSQAFPLCAHTDPRAWASQVGTCMHVSSWGEDTSPSRLKPCPQNPTYLRYLLKAFSLTVICLPPSQV